MWNVYFLYTNKYFSSQKFKNFHKNKVKFKEKVVKYYFLLESIFRWLTTYFDRFVFVSCSFRSSNFFTHIIDWKTNKHNRKKNWVALNSYHTRCHNVWYRLFFFSRSFIFTFCCLLILGFSSLAASGWHIDSNDCVLVGLVVFFFFH